MILKIFAIFLFYILPIKSYSQNVSELNIFDKNKENKSGVYLIDSNMSTSIKWGDFAYKTKCPSRGFDNLKCIDFDYFNNFLKNFISF